jgi:hypothetical protein
MPERLEVQRAPSKAHARPNARKFLRGYTTVPGTPWGETGPTALNRAAAANGNVFPTEPTVTAEDAPNAAKLAGLGYVASPQTAWTGGQFITIGTFRFNWSGTAWAAGPHA